MKNIIMILSSFMLILNLSCEKDESVKTNQWKISSIYVSDTYNNYGWERHEEELKICYKGDTLFYFFHSYDDQYDENIDDFVGVEYFESDTLIGEIYVLIIDDEFVLVAKFSNMAGQKAIDETYSTVIQSGEFSGIDDPVYNGKISFGSPALYKLGLNKINLYCFKEDFNQDTILLSDDSPVMNFGSNWDYRYWLIKTD